MTTETIKNLVRRYYEEVVSTGDVSRIAEFIAPTYTEVHAGTRHELGLDGAREHVLGVRRTYDNLEIRVGRQIAEGEWVASCITARGRHTGEWMGIRPTGKDLEFHGVNVDHVVGGKIAEHSGAADLLTPLLKAGAVLAAG